MRASAVGAALLVLMSGAALAVESPSPAPEDRTTSLTVSPTAAPARAVVVLRGFSDCAVIDGRLLFRNYDGQPDNVVVRTTSKTYDEGRQKYPFVIRLTVPARAAPGPAEVTAQPFCGPPEEYPSSRTVPFRVQMGQLTVRVSPRRPDVGERLRVRASTCDGARGRLTFRIRVGTQVRELPAEVDAGGFASVTTRVGPATGRGEVSLPRAATECPGSTTPAPAGFTVEAAPVEGRTPSAESEPSPSEAETSPEPEPSPPVVPTETSSPAAAAPARQPARDRPGAGLPVLLAVVVAAAAGTTAALVQRGRRG